MKSDEAAQAELKALVAECVGGLRLISESSETFTRKQAYQIIQQAFHKLELANSVAKTLNL